MIDFIIRAALKDRVMVIMATVIIALVGYYSYINAPLDAIPDLEMSGRERMPIGGEVPNPITPPSGCAFHPRCPFANERCKREIPVARPSDDGAQVACHGIEEGRLPAHGTPAGVGSSRAGSNARIFEAGRHGV